MFEVAVANAADEDLGEGVEIVSRTAEAEGLRLRGVSASDALPGGAAPVETPTLEEAYLAFMMARGRTEAALESEEDAA